MRKRFNLFLILILLISFMCNLYAKRSKNSDLVASKITDDYVKDIKSRVEEGDNQAKFILGKLYYYGYNIEIDFSKTCKYLQEAIQDGNRYAFDWIQKKSKKGDSRAQYLMGLLYSKGIGVDKNVDKALKWFERSVYRGKEKGIEMINKFVASGDNAAMFLLGKLYYHGYGVEIDFDKASQYLQDAIKAGNQDAFEWIQKKAKSGDGKNQYLIGILYSKGLGVDKNMDIALTWFESSAYRGNVNAFAIIKKLADAGNLNAKYIVGKLYYYGYAVEKDVKKALALFLEAVTKGHRKVVEWVVENVKKGDYKTQYLLGVLYYHGYGVDLDIKEALNWFNMSAYQGNIEAFGFITQISETNNAIADFILGQLYYYGYSVEINFELAKVMFFKAINGGNKDVIGWLENLAKSSKHVASASHLLGLCYYNGIGVQEDINMALTLFRKSAKDGRSQVVDFLKKESEELNAKAQYILAELYANGDGVYKDKVLAYTYFKMAIDKNIKPASKRYERFVKKLSSKKLKEVEDYWQKVK